MTTDIRAKSIRIADPAAHFSGWHFAIEPHHYWTLGVELKTFVRKKVPYKSYAFMVPADYNFVQGCVFYAKNQPAHFLQVGVEQGLFEIEIFDGWLSGPQTGATGWLTKLDGLAEWLLTGVRPEKCQPLDIAQSKSGLMAWQIMPRDPIPTPA